MLLGCVGALAQEVVPETIELKPGFVGVRYELPLQRLLPEHAPIITWNGLCSGKGVGNVDRECPQGVRLEDVRDSQTNDVIGQKLVVEPVPADLWKDPADISKGIRTTHYIFDLEGRKKEVTIRFKLKIRPLGVDDSRLKPSKVATNPSDSDDDDIGKLVVKFTAARPAATPPPAAPAPTPFVLVKSTADEETLAVSESFDSFDPRTVIKEDANNRANFYVRNADVAPLVTGMLGANETGLLQEGDYLVLHVIKWKPIKDEKSDPERELWALFEKVKKRTIEGYDYEWLPHFASSEKGKLIEKRLYATRIYGSRRVLILPIHLDTPNTWDIKYKLTINQQIPTAIQDVVARATLIGGVSLETSKEEVAAKKDVWGARLMLFRYAASDMIVQVNAATPSMDIPVKEQNKDYSKKYENEGRSWWDVSIGLPANSIKELEYTVDQNGQNSTVSVKKKDRQNAYGFLNLFPIPVDLKANSFLTTPHFVLGVPISGKPLNRPIVAFGSGLYRENFKINFFVGFAFNKVRQPNTLQVGDPATPGQLESDLRFRRQAKFVFGINFPVRQFIEATKGK